MSCAVSVHLKAVVAEDQLVLVVVAIKSIAIELAPKRDSVRAWVHSHDAAHMIAQFQPHPGVNYCSL